MWAWPGSRDHDNCTVQTAAMGQIPRSTERILFAIKFTKICRVFFYHFCYCPYICLNTGQLICLPWGVLFVKAVFGQWACYRTPLIHVKRFYVTVT